MIAAAGERGAKTGRVAVFGMGLQIVGRAGGPVADDIGQIGCGNPDGLSGHGVSVLAMMSTDFPIYHDRRLRLCQRP